MTVLSATAFSVLSLLAATVGATEQFNAMSGDAGSDVNGWLAYTLSDQNPSSKLAVLRASLQQSLGSNVPLTEADMFGYYHALMGVTSPLVIWPGAVLEWCRADLGSSGTTFADQSGNGLGYTGTCTQTATDATLNNLATISTNGTSQAMISSLSLPLASTRPTCVLAVAKLGTFAGTLGFILDGPSGLHTMAIGANSATQAAFANSGTVLVNTAYGAWQLFRGDFSGAGGIDTISAGVTARTGIGAGNHAADPARKIGAGNGQQVQWFELTHLSSIPTKWDLALYKGYLDALTNVSVLHT